MISLVFHQQPSILAASHARKRCKHSKIRWQHCTSCKLTQKIKHCSRHWVVTLFVQNSQESGHKFHVTVSTTLCSSYSSQMFFSGLLGNHYNQGSYRQITWWNWSIKNCVWHFTKENYWTYINPHQCIGTFASRFKLYVTSFYKSLQ